MIENYTKPQAFIRQFLEVVENGTSAALNAFVYGPQYRLSRYTDATEKASTLSAAPSGVQALNPTLGADEVFDQDFVKVYGEDLEANIGAMGAGTNGFHLLSLTEPNKIIYKVDIGLGNTVTAIPKVDGRDVQIGDYLDIVDNDTADTVRRKVVGFEQSGGIDAVIVLDGAATQHYIEDSWPNNEVETLYADVIVKYTGEVASTEYTVDSAGVDLAALPDVAVADATSSPITVTTGVGKLYLHYRALVKPGTTEPIRKIKTTTDINTYFGVIDPDNPLAYGLARALSGSQGKEVYGARVNSNDATGFSEVLKKASQNSNLYSHAPLTYDLDIQKAVASHLDAMSTWDIKRWRRAYVATDAPDYWEILGTDAAEADYEATIDTNGILEATSANVDFETAGIQEGYIVRTGYTLGVHGDTYEVSKVLGPTTLLLKTAPGAAVSDPEKFEVWSSNIVDYAANRSEAIDSRRVINVWCDNGTIINSDGQTEIVENIFLAAEIAGLRSAALPHQGLTRTEVESISDAPLMYTKYTDAELDVAAASGVFIITQDLEGGPIYIRHQLTTETDLGSLYYEDSVGTNVDEISFGVDNIVKGYIGKYNANDDTVLLIRNRLNEFLHNKSRAARAVKIGPQIIDYGKTDLEVAIDPVLRDRINIKISITVPLPLNTIIVEIFAGVTFNN